MHAIVGENGAGKSTLMKILCGAYRPSEGEIRIDGEPVSFHHPLDGQQAGVAIIYQEFNLLPDRAVAENIFLGREPRRGVLIDRGAGGGSAELLGELAPDDPISPRELVGNLLVARQQTVEIAKALSLDSPVMVMDEPTAALAAHEVERLFEQVRRLKERASPSSTSHRLKEVFEIAERITVLKDGKLVKTVASSEVTSPQLVRLMVGRELDQYFPPRAEPGTRGRLRQAPAARRTICCTTSTSTSMPARSLASPASRDRAAPSSRARSSAPTRSTAAPSSWTARSAGSAPRGPPSRPGSASSPRTARPRSLSPSRSATTSALLGAASGGPCAASTSGSGPWSRRWSCASAGSARRSASCPVATSRRSCSPSGSQPSLG